jgi:ubiquinone/menaquinone biosynthesis C-methylase UbiE
MDVYNHNRKAWDKMAAEGSEWSIPADPELIDYARRGEVALYITPHRPCPQDWLPEFRGRDILCLGAGGGQQGPILAAAGARVTVLDSSPQQLALDDMVAQRESLSIEIVTGDMTDLSSFPQSGFDIIVNPVSNLYVPDVRKVWKEAYRVLRMNGVILAGFMNPAFYIFNRDKMDEEGLLEVANSLPYSDLASLSVEEQDSMVEKGWPLEFSHSLEDQIAGQIQAGFTITGFYEDRDPRSALFDYMPVYMATRAVKRL